MKAFIKVTLFIFTIGFIFTRFMNGWATSEPVVQSTHQIQVSNIAVAVFTEQKVAEPDGLADLASKICNSYKPATSSESDECKKDLTECNSVIIVDGVRLKKKNFCRLPPAGGRRSWGEHGA